MGIRHHWASQHPTAVWLLICLGVVAGASYDVVVHTATPGGTMAAVAAAREGARVVLLEPSQYVGAMASSGLGLADFGQHSEVVLGGLCQEFYRRVAKHYNVPFTWPGQATCGAEMVPWRTEPHVAEQAFTDMLAEANVTVELGTRVVSVQHTQQQQQQQQQRRIASVTSADGRVFDGRVFIDGSYEGSLLKMAGVSYTWGREANTTYNESAAGRLPTLSEAPSWPHGDRSAQLPRGISPWADDANTTTIAGVWAGPVAPPGGADDRVGGYDWRLTLTDVPSNSVPIPAPERYDPAEFELVRRACRAGYCPGAPSFPIPGRKTDWKMFGIFGEHPNFQWSYPNASWEGQQEVVAEFTRYALSLIHFFRTDPEVPARTREKMLNLSLCRDEYNRSAHWMPQLYVRSALRMVGKRVLTQADVVRAAWAPDDEGIGMGAYTVDVPGPVQVIVDPIAGDVVTEGALKVSPGPHPTFCNAAQGPFPLPYSTMVPRAGEVENILVPVALSGSHIGFNAIRLEPTWMILGQSAGVAAAMVVTASDKGQDLGKGQDQERGAAAATAVAVQDVNVTALRARLRELGQYLEPPRNLPTPPPTPGADQPLTGRQWYAWKPMWAVHGARITALQDKAVLKRRYASSQGLPPAEVRVYPANASVALAGADAVAQASESDYWLITAASAVN